MVLAARNKYGPAASLGKLKIEEREVQQSGIVMIAQTKCHKSLSQARERMLFQVVRVKMETWWKSLLECLKLPNKILGDRLCVVLVNEPIGELFVEVLDSTENCGQDDYITPETGTVRTVLTVLIWGTGKLSLS